MFMVTELEIRFLPSWRNDCSAPCVTVIWLPGSVGTRGDAAIRLREIYLEFARATAV